MDRKPATPAEIQTAKLLGIQPIEIHGYVYLMRNNQIYTNSKYRTWSYAATLSAIKPTTWEEWENSVIKWEGARYDHKQLELRNAIESCLL